MIRRLLVVALAALCALPGSAAEAKTRNPVAAAAAHARAAFAADVREAEGILASATANLASGLADGTKTAQAAALGYGAAFTFFAGSVKKAADASSAAFAAEVSDAIAAAADDLAGSSAGAGGAVDSFSEEMQAALDGARRRALARARKFAKTFAARGGSSHQRMNVVVPPWTFERRAAPAAPAALAPAEDGIRLLAAVAARADDGTVVVAAGGRAPRSADGDFDVRLRGGGKVTAVGPLLSSTGITVSTDGTWSVSVKLNDPMQGQSEDEGNRVLEFGVDPFDGGLAGRQPGRFLHGGVIGVP